MSRTIWKRSSSGRSTGLVAADTFRPGVNDLTELAALAPNDIWDGSLIHVKDTNEIYSYDLESTDPDDGLNVIEPATGVGRWLRISFTGSSVVSGFADKWVDVTKITSAETITVDKSSATDWPQEVRREEITIDGTLSVVDGYVILGGPNLAEVLAVFNQTQGNDIVVSDGDSIVGEVNLVLSSTGVSSNVDITPGASGAVIVNGKLTVTGVIDPTGIIFDQFDPYDATLNPGAGKGTIVISDGSSFTQADTPYFLSDGAVSLIPLFGGITAIRANGGVALTPSLERGTTYSKQTITSSGTTNLQLPAADTVGGVICFVEHDGDGTGTLTLTPDGADTINALASAVVPPNSTIILISDGTSNWDTYAVSSGGGGGIGGSTGATDNAVLRADGTAGSTLQTSPVTINDSGDITLPGQIDWSGQSSLIDSVTSQVSIWSDTLYFRDTGSTIQFNIDMGSGGLLVRSGTGAFPTPAADFGFLGIRTDSPQTYPLFIPGPPPQPKWNGRHNLLNFAPTKRPVVAATTENVVLTAGSCPSDVDGVTTAQYDRILVCRQTAPAENGIYLVDTFGAGDTSTWSRASDFTDTNIDHIEAGLSVYVQEGSANSQTIFYLVTTGTIIVGTTGLTFLQGAPLVRSDASGTDVIGSSGSPQALNSSTYTAQTGVTDTRDFSDCVWHVTCTDKDLVGGPATKLTVKVEWSEDGTNLSQQGSESITAGVSTLSEYTAEYDISGETAPFNLPAILLPVAAPNAKVSMIADAGAPTVYVRVWRKA